MATYRKEKPDLWADILKLADHNDALVRRAAFNATDAEGRVNLKAVKRNILNQANPALLATLEAACEFTRQVECKEKLADLPHLEKVYEMATLDNAAPRRIFNEAANALKNGTDVNHAIRTAITAQHMRLPLH